MPGLTDIKKNFCTKVIPKNLSAESVAHISMVCSVSWKFFRNLDCNRRNSSPKTIYSKLTVSESDVASAKPWHGAWEIHLDLQLIHLLFNEASSELVSMEGWLYCHCQGRETRRKGCMPNDTRRGLKISDNKSYDEINPHREDSCIHLFKFFYKKMEIKGMRLGPFESSWAETCSSDTTWSGCVWPGFEKHLKIQFRVQKFKSLLLVGLTQ